MIALALLLASALPASPFAAAPLDEPARAEKQLRSCLLGGSVNGSHAGLSEAVVAIRSLCTREIETMRSLRVRQARQALTEPSASRAEDRAVRELNHEIVVAIANFTGLTS